MFGQELYLAESALGYHKIGISKHPAKRIQQLDVPGVLDLTLLHSVPTMFARQTERMVHDALQRYRISPEWFLLPDEVIAALCEAEGEHDLLTLMGDFA